MNIIRLYIENFSCYDKSLIDFAEFKSAIVVGRVKNNDSYANGVGKTSIFKAIEYVLFGETDVKLEKIIREDTTICKVGIDIESNGKEYRIIRKRTNKDTTDISLFEKNASSVTQKQLNDFSDESCWTNITGKKNSDTEKDIQKIIKISFKNFRTTVHFVQNDFVGLSNATSEARRKFLKENLNLAIYSKLEKLAKEKASTLTKEIDKHQTIISEIGNPKEQIELLSKEILTNKELEKLEKINVQENLDKLEALKVQRISLENKLFSFKGNNKELFSSLATAKDNLKTAEASVNTYTNKKTNCIANAKEIIDLLKSLKEKQSSLQEIDTNSEKLKIKKSENEERIAQCKLIVASNATKIEELSIPIPDNSVCKHCRQPLSEEHRKICSEEIKNEIAKLKKETLAVKQEAKTLIEDTSTLNAKITSNEATITAITKINNDIVLKTKELNDLKSLNDEISNFLNSAKEDFSNKKIEFEKYEAAVAALSLTEEDKVKNEIKNLEAVIDQSDMQYKMSAKKLAAIQSELAVQEYSVKTKTKESERLVELQTNYELLKEKYKVYPHLVKGFSSTGIPTLIIQDVLDDLQEKSNEILDKLKPGLVCKFIVEKQKDDSKEETLDIKYELLGREREYGQLSGAQQLSVTFALKLGMSFFLQQALDVKVNLLLLDEIDQAFDHASVNAYAEIIKSLHDEFKILVISHNDLLKDKFNYAVLVEQNSSLVSTAKVVSSW